MKNENWRKIIDQLPDAAHPLKLNDVLAHLLPKQAKNYDSYLSKLQRFIIWINDLATRTDGTGASEECSPLGTS